MSGQPFMTKNTLGLLTIDWNNTNSGSSDEPDPYEQTVKTPEMLAMEAAVKEKIAQRKAEKERRRKKQQRSQSPSQKAEQEAKKKKQPQAEEAAARLAKAEEKQKRLEQEREAQREKEAERKRQAAQEAALRLAAEQEEAAQKKAHEEEAQLLRKLEEEAEARRQTAAQAKEAAPQSSSQKQQHQKAQRRVSFFPCTPDNEGLVQAGTRYGRRRVPLDWERPEWTMDFGHLRHAETLHHTYSWEKPEWVTHRSLLKPTTLGKAIQAGGSLERPIVVLRRRHSFGHSFRMGQTGMGPSALSVETHHSWDPSWW